jgi:hypothetical protein
LKEKKTLNIDETHNSVTRWENRKPWKGGENNGWKLLVSPQFSWVSVVLIFL